MIYVFLAGGFEEIEAVTAIDILRRAGLDVLTAGVPYREVAGSHGIRLVADIGAADVSFDDMRAIVLPGGMPGTINLEKSETVASAISHMAKTGGLIAAICAAPSILGRMGLLRGKRAVCFPGYEKELTGAVICDEAVCRDGNIITGKAAGASAEFALAVVSALAGEDKARSVWSAIHLN